MTRQTLSSIPPPIATPPPGAASLRVGIIAPPWLPVPAPAYGGTEAAVDVLARGLQEAGQDVVLFTTTDSSCPVPRRATAPSAPRWRMGHMLVELPHVIDAYDALVACDIIHDHTLLGPLYAANVRPRPTTCATVHGSFDLASRKVYGSIDPEIALIAISHHQASTSNVPIEAVIHHGIDTAAIEVGDGRGGYVAFLGRMTPSKGVHLAIEAARCADVPLRIAAKMIEDDEIRYFRDRVEPLLGRGAEYVGELSHHDKLALLRGASALLVPVEWDEPFGMVMIEALACGTPVLAFPRGSTPEIVLDGVTGFLCADVSAMAAKLADVADLSRDRCRRDVEERFSMERLAADHIAAYRRIVETSSSADLRLRRRPSGVPERAG